MLFMPIQRLTPEEIFQKPAIVYINSHEGATHAQVAEKFGIKMPTLSFWLQRLRDEGYADRMAPWLSEAKPRAARKPVTATYPVTVTASAQADRQGTYHTDIKLDSQAFATPITSATTDGAATAHFPEHALVLVNPAATPTSGDFVLTLDTRDNATAIKRLQRNGEKTLLMSLNPALDPIPAESPAIRIVGVVEEVQHTPYRRTPRR